VSQSNDNLLHKLWTQAVGQPGYDKEEWKRMERIVWGAVASAEGCGCGKMVCASSAPLYRCSGLGCTYADHDSRALKHTARSRTR